jgi:glucose-1-phosphate thymidylyltransferase
MLSQKSNRVGIILAGGLGTRLYPITKCISKHLLPVYDKPMIYYPLSTLMLLGIKKILIILKKEDLYFFKKLLGDGSHLGIDLNYQIQDKPNGIAESLIISKKFTKTKKICLILGDNIFYGSRLIKKLKKVSRSSKNTIITYTVKNPKEYGILELDKKGKPKNIVEKPKSHKSNLAVTGLYFYENEVVKIVERQKPSKRNELEITDLNTSLLRKKKLNYFHLDRGNAWLDAGTVDSYIEASTVISIMEKRQGLNIGSIEEAALFNNWINKKSFAKLVKKENLGSPYYKYLSSLI